MDGVARPQLRHAGLNLGTTDAETHDEVESDVFGFWIFLMSDAVLFALLFAIYGTHAVGAPPAARARRRNSRSAPPSSRRCCCSPAASPSAWRRSR